MIFDSGGRVSCNKIDKRILVEKDEAVKCFVNKFGTPQRCLFLIFSDSQGDSRMKVLWSVITDDFLLSESPQLPGSN